jgi:hypothetical protein
VQRFRGVIGVNKNAPPLKCTSHRGYCLLGCTGSPAPACPLLAPVRPASCYLPPGWVSQSLGIPEKGWGWPYWQDPWHNLNQKRLASDTTGERQPDDEHKAQPNWGHAPLWQGKAVLYMVYRTITNLVLKFQGISHRSFGRAKLGGTHPFGSGDQQQNNPDRA